MTSLRAPRSAPPTLRARSGRGGARGGPATADPLDLRLPAAGAVAREAGRAALGHFRERPVAPRLDFEGHRDHLAATDAAVAAPIRRRLAQNHPDDAFLGEETGGAWGDRVRVVDPVDGTADLLRGIPASCVPVALVRDGRTEVGAIHDPSNDEPFAAARGRS